MTENLKKFLTDLLQIFTPHSDEYSERHGRYIFQICRVFGHSHYKFQGLLQESSTYFGRDRTFGNVIQRHYEHFFTFVTVKQSSPTASSLLAVFWEEAWATTRKKSTKHDSTMNNI